MNPCPKCNGTGQFRDLGKCYQCDGSGSVRPTVPASESKHPALRADRERVPERARTAEELARDEAAGDRAFEELKRMGFRAGGRE